MEQDRYRRLLEKYWSAEANEEEERELKALAAQYQDTESRELAKLFRYFEEEKNTQLESGFDDSLLARLHQKPHPVKWIMPVLKVAAILLIALLPYFLIRNTPEKQRALANQDTFNDPQQAYQQTKKALLVISQNLNSGDKYAGEIGNLNKLGQVIHTKEQQP